MRNNGGYGFGPSMHKPTKKKDPTRLMKRSLKQLKKTRVFYSASLATKYNNNDTEQGNCNVANRGTKDKVVAQKSQQTPSKEPRVVPQPINLARSSRPNNGIPSSSKFLPKKSMPSSPKANNGVVSFRRTTKSRPYSSRLTNGIDSSHKNTNGGPPPLKNVEKPRTSYTRLNNGEASHTKNTAMPRSCSLSSKNDMVSPPVNIKNSMILSNSYSGLVPSGKNNESLKSRPSRPRNEVSSVLKDGSDSIFGILEESNHSSIFGNSRIAFKNVNGEAQNKLMDVHKRKFGLSKDKRTNAEKFNTARMKPMDCSIQLENLNIGLVEDGRTIDGKLRRRTEALSRENPETHGDDDSEEGENRKPTKIRRRLILNDYEDDDDGDDNLTDVEIDTAGSTSQTDVVKDSPIKVSNPFLSESLKLQQYGSLPIDEPVWSGLIKISSKENVSLAAHLSTKYCEEVWKLAGSLQPEIVVTKLSRKEAWPKSFEASRPTDDNIALYFLPCQMRQDAELDQLIKEVMENDMILQAAIGEDAEMLIFPSILLPEQHQTFQGKPYLRAVFKGRKNKAATVEVKQHGKEHCAEGEMGKQQASHSSVDKQGHRLAPLNTEAGPETPEEMERQDMEPEQNPSLAGASTLGTATGDLTMNATTSANNGQIHPCVAIPTGAFFGFVVQSNPKVEQLIHEMHLEGAVVVAMRGEMIGSGLGQAAASGREEDKMPPSSS
uniref:Uncharacterized protein n=1 Tax=Avena sativa TaxID=4498 RepID=A0ACD5WSQ7_AVESA